MYEVELKVEADHEPVRRRLRERDADRLATVAQEDTYFDAPHRSFVETDEALRVRRERPVDGGDWTTAITYKGPLVDDESKSREELETGVDDGETVATILDRLGFDAAATVSKERERYRLGEHVVTLDAVEGLGEFVEVETRTTGPVGPAREGVRRRLADLGLDPERGIRTSYLGLLSAGDASK